MTICPRDRDALIRLLIAVQDGSSPSGDEEAFIRLHKSRDLAVRYGLSALCDVIGDFRPDAVPLDKTEWDHLERIRLVLLSGSELRKVQRSPVSMRHALLLLVAMAIVIGAAFYGGLGWYILLNVAVLLPALVAYLRKAIIRRYSSSPFRDLIEPFTSIRQLDEAHRSTPVFRKRRYPLRRRPKSWHPVAQRCASCAAVLGAIVVAMLILPAFVVALVVDHWYPDYEVA